MNHRIISLLAEDGPRDTGPDFGKASPFGLIVVVLLLIGTFLLVWSMSRHLRKLPKSFDAESAPPDTPDVGGAKTIGVDPDLTFESPSDGTPRDPDR